MKIAVEWDNKINPELYDNLEQVAEAVLENQADGIEVKRIYDAYESGEPADEVGSKEYGCEWSVNIVAL